MPDRALPEKPQPPDPAECCRSNCTPCVFEIYEEALARWEREVEALRREDEKDRRS